MEFFSDLADGATELPRVAIGGLAIALGADREKTNNFLGLSDKSESLRSQVHEKVAEHPQGLLDTIKAHPCKFIG